MAALAMMATPAAAAEYQFSYGFGGTTYASGSIFTDESQPCGPGCFVVADVTGVNRGAAITGFDAFDLTSDQYFYPTTSGAYVDGSGLTYSVGTTSYNIYATGSNYNEFDFDTATGAQIGDSAFVTFFRVTPVVAAPVPEPTSWGLMIAGLGLTGMSLRRRPRRAPRAAVA